MSSPNALIQPKASGYQVFKTFLKLGLTSFGGPIAHLGYFRKELVEKQAWVSESQYSQLLAICQFLPGPASSQLGFVLGMLRAGWLGALAAFFAFTLPSALLLIGFAAMLPTLSSNIGEAIVHGLKLVAFAVVADAVWAMWKKLCPDLTRRVIAIIAVAIILLLSSVWSQIIVVIFGAIAGMLFCQSATSDEQDSMRLPYGKILSLILAAVFAILLLFALFLSHSSELVTISQSFYRAGALVFGGGHVVLPLLEEVTVAEGLISQDQFLAGYGAAQAIPGPMFAFSAYLGAIIPSSEAVSWSGAMTALAFMFMPGFLLVTAVLPAWQHISNKPKAVRTIAGVNAAVVGLLAAALYHPIFTAGISSLSDFIIAFIGLLMLLRGRLSPLWVVVWCVLANITLTLV